MSQFLDDLRIDGRHQLLALPLATPLARLQAVLEAAIAPWCAAAGGRWPCSTIRYGNTGRSPDHAGIPDLWAAGRRDCGVVGGDGHAAQFSLSSFSRDDAWLHGGGNFGDLYRYQRHREKVVRAYPGHRIVILPQTVHFRDREQLRKSAERMRGHPDLHLFVRDRRSLDLAQGGVPRVFADLGP